MKRPPKDKVLEKIRQRLDRARELRTVERGSQDFKKWKRDTRVAIEWAFGEGGRHSKEFSSIKYSLSGFSVDTPDSNFQAAYVRGVDTAIAIIESFIDEVLEYWNERESSVEPKEEEGKVLIGNGKKIWVVHGQNEKAVTAIFNWLRRIGLEPMEWVQVEGLTGSGSPDTLEIIKKGFENAQAFLILFTDDEEVRLRNELVGEGESDQSGYQPRPNVLFEGGMACAIDRGRTVFVELGALRRFSDLAGVNNVRLGSKPKTKDLNKLIGRLQSAGCVVDKSGDHWMDTEDFERAIHPPKP